MKRPFQSLLTVATDTRALVTALAAVVILCGTVAAFAQDVVKVSMSAGLLK
jgi:hypothetical protein